MSKETPGVVLNEQAQKIIKQIEKKIKNGQELTKEEKELYLALDIEPDPVVEKLRTRKEIPTSPGALRDISDSQKYKYFK